MRRARAALTYVNVVSTVALFLTLSGGVVWAADKVTSKDIAKGAVKNKNLAKNAVKNKNLAKNAVNSAKLAKGAVKIAGIADGSINFAKLATGTSVVASASAGPYPANQSGQVAFNPPLTVTPVAGQPLTLLMEVRGNLKQEGGNPCAAVAIPVLNGNPLLGGLAELLLISSAPIIPTPLATNGVPASDISLPIGMNQPGVPLSISLFVDSSKTCTSDSTVQVSAVVTQVK